MTDGRLMRRLIRQQILGLPEKTVLVYSGTLGPRNPPDKMVDCIEAFFKVYGKHAHFMLLTGSDESFIKLLADGLEACGLKRGKDWKVYRAKSNEVSEYLNTADWALQVFFSNDETLLPVKFAEYMAMGLPIITHSTDRATVGLVRKYRVGVVVDKDDYSELERAVEKEEKEILNMIGVKDD